jgi:membrane fusion protein, multidrug efflux system
MNRLRTLLGIGVGVAVVVGAAWYFTTRTPAATAARSGGRNAANQAVTVGLATVAKGDIPIIVKALGTVTPLATVTVKTQITGQLIQVAFTEGQFVKKGDLLAVVDPRPYEVALQQATGTLEKDEALLKNANIDLERYRTLVAQNSVSRQIFDTQAALVRQYEAALVTDRAGVDAAKLNLVYTRIVAPTDGRIGLRLVDQGNYVTMGDATGICVITLMQPMSVLFTIPEDTLPSVRQRLKNGATLQATALDRAQKVELGVGKLSTTDNQMDTTTGTVKLRSLFDNTDEALFPNQFVNIRLLVDTVKDALVVPVAAIQRGQPGTFVYHVKPDDTVEIRVVETGATDGDKIAVLKGLVLNDQVVIDGTDRLRDGAKIRKPQPPAGTPGPPVAAAPPAGATPATPAPATPDGATNGRRRGGNGQQGNNTGGTTGSTTGTSTDGRSGGAGRPAQSNQ